MKSREYYLVLATVLLSVFVLSLLWEFLAEKLRISIETNTFNEVGHKTASFGVAGLRKDEAVEDVIARADSALYSAKQSDRNRVELSD